ncbi:MAG: transposase, partial [Bacteroidota bacterium]
GGYICGFDHAPAGTKRISNLLRCKKWKADLIDQFFFERTRQRIDQLQKQGKRPLLLWDDSRIEKPESWFIQGLCSVWSSKGKRLTKIKKGFYRPPASRICVPGFEWTAILLSNLGGVPSVCQMSWWTRRGKFKEWGSNIIYRLLRKVHHQIGRAAVHIMDRGYANYQMLEWLFDFEQDFIIRWKKNQLLEHAEKGRKKTHLLARSFKGRQQRSVWDKYRKKSKRVSIAWAPVNHPDFAEYQLFLVILRDKYNYNSPMYLITSLNIESPAQAWEVAFSYLHRWEVEQGFRFGKSELAMESPRLWFWENRLKLLAIVALVYDFLLRFIRQWAAWVQGFLRNWCHRTGERYRKASIPLYRLRIAIHHCLFFLMAQNSG